jgi:hypothetical protein
MSDSLKTALSSADLMIYLLKSKIEAIEKFKAQLSEYDRELTEDEQGNLWDMINQPDAWNEDNHKGEPTFCAGEKEQKTLKKCVKTFIEFARTRIPDYDDM